MAKAIKQLLLYLLMAIVLLGAGPVAAEESMRLAVLAFRSKDKTQQQWKPLANFLAESLRRPVTLTAYDFNEMSVAISQNEVDIVLTNPGNYIAIRHRNGVSGPLATLVNKEGQFNSSAFGGVIFTRADASHIQQLSDIKGQRIAVTQLDSFGGFQAQAFEMLEIGLPLPSNEDLVTVGMPHDSVVRAVVEGRAEVGFVRAAVLEAMAAEGKISMDQVRVINRQNLPLYPYAASTRLYPEWPVSVLPHVEDDTARQIAVALLSLQRESKVSVEAGIAGFNIPADYSGVESLLRRLRLPPFDVGPQFTLEDFWRRYTLWLSALGVLTLLLVGLGVRFAVQNKNLLLAQVRLHLATKGTGLGIWDLNLAKGEEYYSLRMYEMLGYTPQNGPQDLEQWLAIAHPEDKREVFQTLKAADKALLNEYVIIMRLRDFAGHWRWIESRSQVQRNAQGKAVRRTGTHLDITERKLADEKLQRAASVFSHAREGIVITDARGIIVEVNEAFTRISGFSREDAIGQNPNILRSGVQSPEFYAAMWSELLQSGHWSGEIWNRHRNGQLYAELLTISAVWDSAGQVQNFVSLFTDITTIKENQQLLERSAHFDTLTGLPNRVLLADRLRHAMLQSQRRGQVVAVVFLDLDGFKWVNDTYGHDVGDVLLVALAKRIKAALREGDTLARIGGDEFIAVLENLESVQDCEPVLDRMLLAASDRVPVQGSHGEIQLQVSASMGITLYPQDGVDADQLMRHADQAMYQAKQAGKNRYQLFDVVQNAAVQSHHEAMSDIRRALDKREFVLHYQPKVNMKTGKVVGAEALIRWQHPERGLLAPGLFLPGVETDAVGLDLGEWVIGTALGQMSEWAESGLQLPVSVNVGTYQLQHHGFAERLGSLLAGRSSVNPGWLELEVLESSAVQDMARLAEIMESCRAMGVKFALDDFGTGYSSLSYLRRLQAETLKIDQSFVRDMLVDPDDLAIVNGVIGLASAFGRDVIAEGVETLAHGQRLVELGCHLAQGYGIARPMPAEKIPSWIQQWTAQPVWSHA